MDREVPIDGIKRVCFVGAGTMGCYNSLISSMAGYEVVLYDISEEVLERVQERHREWGAFLIEQGTMGVNQEKLEAGISRISLTSDPKEAARDSDLLSESVFERLELKRQVHRQFDALLSPHAIMTTNTSTLPLSDIESAVHRGEKFAAMHFHQSSPLVDIVAGPRTSTETIDSVKRFVKSQGQTYILLKKERAGYLHNAMYSSLLGTAMILVVVGGADFQDVDRAWMLNQNSEVGPFGMMDFVGLNIIMDAIEGTIERSDEMMEGARLLSDLLRPYRERGDLGVKTGRGFYTYPEPAFQKPDFITGREENRELSRALLNSVISTALTLVIEGYADIEDVDRSWILTHNPEIGPFGMMDNKGLDIVSQELEEQAKMIELLMGGSEILTQTTEMTADFLRPYIERGELGVKTGKGFYTYPDPVYKKSGFLTGNG
jgi:enoyl-CoA hydratase/3-hydroxyacyl-CoA dehydrogenase